jgi:Flp pilus assembly protein TadD
MYVVPFILGEAALGAQKWEEASTELTKCLELNPHFDQAMLGLARALIFQEKPAEALHWARQAIQYNPENYRAWYQLGFIDARTDKQAAIVDYEKAVSIEGNFAPLRRDLGMLYYEQQNYTEAAQHLGKAVALGMNDAQLYNFLGISYSRTKQFPRAIASYKEALKKDPDLAEAHLNLGFAYEQLHRTNLAAREYQRACELKQEVCDLIKSRQK